MNIFDNEDENVKKFKEKMANSKRMISRLDVTDAIGEVVSSALSAMVLSNDPHFANLIAAINAKKSLDKLFSEESLDEEEKETEDVSDTKQEPEKQSADLKHMLFNHAADCSEPLLRKGVENSRTAEMRRSAKHAALLSLIENAGLIKEYHEWLDTGHVKEN